MEGEVAFRDFLRNNPKAAEEYARIKKRAANECKGDKEIYRKIKNKFIKETLEKL